MTKIPAKMPLLVKKMFPNYVWDFFSEVDKFQQKTLFLTFDDGPQPEITEYVLRQLKTYNAKATFFCIGANIEKHPELFQQIIDEGHAIGNHTHHHLEGWKTKTEEYIQNTALAENSIKSVLGHKVNLFRPPYGRIKKAQGKKLMAQGYKIVMWDVVAKDWMQSISPEDCYLNIKKNSVNGSIIVMHDSKKASHNVHYVLPKVLEHFSKQGFQFKAISD